MLQNAIAGITVSFIGLSLGAAFGVMSGRGAFIGILSAALIAFFTSTLGGTRIQCSGPTGPMTAVTALIVSYAYDNIPLQFPGINPDHFVNIVLFLTGALILILGILKLGKLIYLYDNNYISLAASTNVTYTEDRAKRFEAYGWHVQTVDDGNDLDAIDRALRAARAETVRPSIIMVHTIIGYGAPHKQNTFGVHGSPLGPDEVKAAKENLGWTLDPPFYIPG